MRREQLRMQHFAGSFLKSMVFLKMESMKRYDKNQGATAMKLLIIRHADPDYTIDSLTPAGWQEAELLSERLTKENIKSFYVSPLGRAKDTASLTLKKLGQEVVPQIRRPDRPERFSICWDWLPQDWTKESRHFDRELWSSTETFETANVRQTAEWVWAGLDQVLADHGYQRDGACYRAVRSNEDKVALFCHFGVECVLLSHLLGISPMCLWHGLCAAPSSVTTLATEERRQGMASFRMLAFGDTSHLYAGGRKPSFAARFCETFGNAEQRHD